jgi:hypothetical protein
MGNTSTAEYLIAALTAMVIVVAFRRKTPKAIELAVWISLVWVCVLTITSTGNPQARALTNATVWGAGRIVGTIAGLTGQDVLRWMYGTRFAIAGWVVLIFVLDLFVLALVSTRRQANSWIPVTKLGEWMVLPGLHAPEPERAAISGVDEINQRLNVWAARAAAASLAWASLSVIWLRDVEIPAAAGGLKNLESGIGGAWRRVAAGRPQLGEVRISRVVPAPTNAGRGAGRSKRRVAARPAPLEPDIVDIKLLAARVKARKLQDGTTPRKSRRRTAPIVPQPDARTDKNGPKKHRPSRLAS